jgi:hypothetical protein
VIAQFRAAKHLAAFSLLAARRSRPSETPSWRPPARLAAFVAPRPGRRLHDPLASLFQFL